MARKGGNPGTYFTAKGSESVTKTVTVKLSPTLEAFVKSLPNRSEWIRQAIIDKMERDLQQQGNS
jgi:metal-responsive CopG/Arc/MetJ family transcriptional regulator